MAEQLGLSFSYVCKKIHELGLKREPLKRRRGAIIKMS